MDELLIHSEYLSVRLSVSQAVSQSVSPSIRPSFHQFDSHFIIFIDINDKIWNMRDDFYQQFVRPSVHFIGSRTSSTEKLMVPRKKTVCKKCCCLLSVTTTTWISRISQYNWNQNVLLPCAKKSHGAFKSEFYLWTLQGNKYDILGLSTKQLDFMVNVQKLSLHVNRFFSENC